MSINITVHGKPVTVQRERGILRDLESVKTHENDHRKKQRIVQVREQSKEIANRIRRRVGEERERQERQIDKIKHEELRKWKKHKLEETQQNYQKSWAKMMDANEEAKREIEEDFLKRQHKKELDLIAAQRGRHAVQLEQSKRPPVVVKKKAKSISVQTENVDPNEKRGNFQKPPTTFRNSGNETESRPDPVNAFTWRPLNRDDGLPQPAAEIDNVISARSVELLEMSKKFVENAHLRLNDIEKRTADALSREQANDYETVHQRLNDIEIRTAEALAREQASDFETINQRLNDIEKRTAEALSREQQLDFDSTPLPVHSKPIPVSPIKIHQPPKTALPRSPLKTVNDNKTARLRLKSQSKPVEVAKPRVVIPKKTIPSMVDEEKAKQTGKSKSPQKVSYYDHPNRFTKQYDVPKNLVIKVRHLDQEADAVTNALSETQQMEQEELAKEERAKELKRRELIREIEAGEKSQVRRDYEMLAKQLEEVRRAESKATFSNSSPMNVSQSFATDVVVQQRRAKQTQKKMNEEFERIAHQPVLITCPEVGSRNLGFNVAFENPAQESHSEITEISASDSCKSIILEQRKKDTDLETPNRPEHREKNLALNLLDKLMGEIEKQKTELTQQMNTKPISRKPKTIQVRNESEKVRVVAANSMDDITDSSEKPLKIVIQVEDSSKRRASPGRNQFVGGLSVPKTGTDASLSTCYCSPPSEIGTDLNKYLSKGKRPENPIKKPEKRTVKGKSLSNQPQLKSCISKLLGMSRAELHDIEVSDVSEVPTLTESIIAVETNQPMPVDEKKMENVSKFIEDNYSFLREVENSIQRKEKEDKRVKRMPTKPQDLKKNWKETFKGKEDQNPRKVLEIPKTIDQVPIVSTNTTSSSNDAVLKKYTDMAVQYNQRISALTEMIERIRHEKEKLMHENSMTISDQAVDSSTKYRDFPMMVNSTGRTRGSSSSDMSKLSDLKSNSHELEEIFDKNRLNENTGIMKKKNNNLESNKFIGLSRDSGISMSRPVTSADQRDSPVVVNSTEKRQDFEPMLKDIPRISQNQNTKDYLDPEMFKRRPPTSITRFSPELLNEEGHELSTIVEVETPVTSKLNVSGKFGKSDSAPIFNELTRFPTFEEFEEKKNEVEADLDLSGVMAELKRRNILPDYQTDNSVEQKSVCSEKEVTKDLEELLSLVGLNAASKFGTIQDFTKEKSGSKIEGENLAKSGNLESDPFGERGPSKVITELMKRNLLPNSESGEAHKSVDDTELNEFLSSFGIPIEKFASLKDYVLQQHGSEMTKQRDGLGESTNTKDLNKTTEQTLGLLAKVMAELKKKNMFPSQTDQSIKSICSGKDISRDLEEFMSKVGVPVKDFTPIREFAKQTNVSGIILSELEATKSSEKRSNITEYEVDSEDEKITSKNDKNEVMGIPKSPKKLAFSSRISSGDKTSPRRKQNNKKQGSLTESSSGLSGVQALRRSDESSTTRDIPNITDELLNDLKDSLKKLGLKWAANMLEKSHIQKNSQLSSNSSLNLSSPEDASPKLNNERNSGTAMSLISDTVTSDMSTSDGALKGSNLKDFILNELKKKSSRSNKTSTDTSLESTLTNQFLLSILSTKEDLKMTMMNKTECSTTSEGTGGLRTSTPVQSNANSKLQNSSDKSKANSMDSSQGLFSGESKLSSVRGDDRSNNKHCMESLVVPDLHLDLARYQTGSSNGSSPDNAALQSTTSTQYNFNENNKRKPIKRSNQQPNVPQ